MDATRFDALVRAFADAGTRRRLLVRLAALLPIGGLLPLPDEAAAERPGNRMQRRTPQRNRKQRNKRQRNNNSNNNKNKGKDKPGPKPTCDVDSCDDGCCRADGSCSHDGREGCTGVGTPCCDGCCRDGQCHPCAGCCDGQGQCLPGNDDTACGRDGETCRECIGNGGHCRDGRCQCDADLCPNGCCTNGPGNPGFCEEGDNLQLCGKGGELCVACPTGTSCNVAQGRCQCLNTDAFCGLGTHCTACATGTSCTVQGECRCTATSCPAGTVCCANETQCGKVDGETCTQDSDCCSGNCFNAVCADFVTHCDDTPCNPPAKGCAGDNCCGSPAPGSCSDHCCSPQNSKCCDNTCCPDNWTCCGDLCCGPNDICCQQGFQRTCCAPPATHCDAAGNCAV